MVSDVRRSARGAFIVCGPCKVLDYAFSPTDLATFVNGVPGCDGIGPCSYTIMQ